MSTLKVDVTIVPLFFLISYLLVSKVEICLKIIVGQKSQKAVIVRLLQEKHSIATVYDYSTFLGL